MTAAAAKAGKGAGSAGRTQGVPGLTVTQMGSARIATVLVPPVCVGGVKTEDVDQGHLHRFGGWARGHHFTRACARTLCIIFAINL